ncbi:MAG: DUF3768 domain-containing protein [Rhodospirillaceae bacterium]|nr:DUF3768 domain-containing protein [Rhodospirillaceae bacterium]
MTERKDKVATIRRLNDEFRKTFVGGRIFLTRGILGLSLELRREIIRTVQSYAEWEPGNDHHDFGAVQIQGQKFFWKIDCNDLTLTYPSPDASDPKQTRRVLTIMTASEN